MHAEAESSNKRISISFTALLYGVVIDAALHRVHDTSFTPANVLLFAALIIVIQDFFFYHEDLKRLNVTLAKAEMELPPAQKLEAEREQMRETRTIFVFDVALLGAWYVLAVSADSTLQTYLLCLTAFFASVGVWNQFTPAPAGGLPLRYSHWPVTAVTGLSALAAYELLPGPVSAESFEEWTPLAYLFLGVPLLAFTMWRLLVYWPWLRKEIDRVTRAAHDLAEIPSYTEEKLNEFQEVLARINDAVADMNRISVELGQVREGVTRLPVIESEFTAFRLELSGHIVELRDGVKKLAVRVPLKRRRTDFAGPGRTPPTRSNGAPQPGVAPSRP
jgi:hypothetical protein